jgi:hypothetical protein
LEEARRRLESIIVDMRREKFGAKSEKLRPDEHHLPLEDVEIAQTAIEAETGRIAFEMATLSAANADLAAVNQAADATDRGADGDREDVGAHAFGTRSERLRSDRPSDEQIAFVFDEIATGVAAVAARTSRNARRGRARSSARIWSGSSSSSNPRCPLVAKCWRGS